jgi:hypothetical protein
MLVLKQLFTFLKTCYSTLMTEHNKRGLRHTRKGKGHGRFFQPELAVRASSPQSIFLRRLLHTLKPVSADRKKIVKQFLQLIGRTCTVNN